MGIESKGWDWDDYIAKRGAGHWLEPADEFLPEALRWREAGYARVLDLGCGLGRHSIFLASLGMRVCAFDISESALKETAKLAAARSLGGKVECRQGDAAALPFHPGEFDAVVAFHSMYHTDYPSLIAIIENLRQGLRPGGRAFFTFNSRANPSFLAPSATRVDEHTIICQDEPEVGIPHCYLDADEVPNLLSAWKLLSLRDIDSRHFQEGAPERRGRHIYATCKV